MTARTHWWQRSIGARIIGLFLGLLLAVQLASVMATHASLSVHAHRVLPARLQAGEGLLQSLLDRQAQTLIGGARLLAADYGFRDALSSGDSETIASVLANHGARIGATEAALLGTDFAVRATTAQHPRELAPVARRLAEIAGRTGQASDVALLAGRPYQAVLVPVKAPLVVGWVLMAFPVETLAADLHRLSGLDLTLLTRPAPGGPWQVGLTSLDRAHTAALARQAWTPGQLDSPMAPVAVLGEEIGVRSLVLTGRGSIDAGGCVLALVSLSVDESVRLPPDLQLALIGITGVATGVFALGSVFTARRVTTPLRSLAAAAERLGGGDFATPMRTRERVDEIGELADAFERMRQNIAGKQAEVLRLAYWDELTGLPNRARFRDAVRQALAAAAAGETVAVIMIDLDRFKHVNDVLGYRFGDLLLRGVAERLTQELVPEGDLVGRIGGDEFGILVRQGDEALALAIARRIETSFDVPLLLEDHRVDMGAGIGIACWPRHADDGDALLNRAEIAMYAAKRKGSVPVMYDPSIDIASAQTLSLMSELRLAVGRDELRLYLQPKFALQSGRAVGAEALLRWQHPQRGLVPPMSFIPFAEQTGFIRVLTLWMFEEAARRWQAFCGAGVALTLSVNLSTRDLLDPELPQKFMAVLDRVGIAPAAFCLEITESAIMDDPQRALETLDRLSALGFELSIDDFGTGYSSLAYLKRLPVDELKIDRSFVMNMQSDADDAMIVRSTIDLAHNLGIRVVAEGVEDAAVWDMLRSLDCDQAQGYHMARPMPATEFAAWVAASAAAPQRSAEALQPEIVQ